MKILKQILAITILFFAGLVDAKQTKTIATRTTTQQYTPNKTIGSVTQPKPTPQKAYTQMLTTLQNTTPSTGDYNTLEQIEAEVVRQLAKIEKMTLSIPIQPNKRPIQEKIEEQDMIQMNSYAEQQVANNLEGITHDLFPMTQRRNRPTINKLIVDFINRYQTIQKATTVDIIYDAIRNNRDITIKYAIVGEKPTTYIINALNDAWDFVTKPY